MFGADKSSAERIEKKIGSEIGERNMNRAERRRLQKQRAKNTIPAPLNITNFTVEQISQSTGVKIESLKAYLSARESEIRDAAIRESQEKLWKAEDYIAVANILISLYAIKMTWGYTKANQRFLENINAARDYVERIGIEKAYEYARRDMGIELEFDSIDINKEFGFGEEHESISVQA